MSELDFGRLALQGLNLANVLQAQKQDAQSNVPFTFSVRSPQFGFSAQRRSAQTGDALDTAIDSLTQLQKQREKLDTEAKKLAELTQAAQDSGMTMTGISPSGPTFGKSQETELEERLELQKALNDLRLEHKFRSSLAPTPGLHGMLSGISPQEIAKGVANLEQSFGRENVPEGLRMFLQPEQPDPSNVFPARFVGTKQELAKQEKKQEKKEEEQGQISFVDRALRTIFRSDRAT